MMSRRGDVHSHNIRFQSRVIRPTGAAIPFHIPPRTRAGAQIPGPRANTPAGIHRVLLRSPDPIRRIETHRAALRPQRPVLGRSIQQSDTARVMSSRTVAGGMADRRILPKAPAILSAARRRSTRIYPSGASHRGIRLTPTMVVGAVTVTHPLRSMRAARRTSAETVFNTVTRNRIPASIRARISTITASIRPPWVPLEAIVHRLSLRRRRPR